MSNTASFDPLDIFRAMFFFSEGLWPRDGGSLTSTIFGYQNREQDNPEKHESGVCATRKFRKWLSKNYINTSTPVDIRYIRRDLDQILEKSIEYTNEAQRYLNAARDAEEKNEDFDAEIYSWDDKSIIKMWHDVKEAASGTRKRYDEQRRAVEEFHAKVSKISNIEDVHIMASFNRAFTVDYENKLTICRATVKDLLVSVDRYHNDDRLKKDPITQANLKEMQSNLQSECDSVLIRLVKFGDSLHYWQSSLLIQERLLVHKK